MPKPKRFSAPLPPDIEEALDLIANENSLSRAKAAEQMMRQGLTMESLRVQGNKIVAIDSAGQQRLLADKDSVVAFRLPSRNNKK